MGSFFKKGKLPLLAVLLPLLFAGAVYAEWNYVPNTQNLAALTEAQVQAILSVLSSFGVDNDLLKNIESSLRDGAQHSAETSIEISLPEEEFGVSPPIPEPFLTPTGTLHISVAETSLAGTVPSGTVYVQVASFIFDATALKEDTSFSKLKFLYTDDAKYDPYNCAIFSGPEEFMTRYTKGSLNPDWVHPAGTDDYEFVLTTSLVVLKGEKKNVDIKCTTNTNAFKGTGSFSWGLSGVDGKATFNGVGVESKEVIVPTVEPNVGNTMIFTS